MAESWELPSAYPVVSAHGSRAPRVVVSHQAENDFWGIAETTVQAKAT
jgi:hypothetical protein